MSTIPNPLTPEPSFDPSDLPPIPTRLRSGDSWNWNAGFASYISALYTLSYIFNSDYNRFVIPALAITPDADGESFDIQATSAQTGACIADTYDVIAVLTGIVATPAAGQQVTIPLQRCIVDPNLVALTAPLDTRSFVKKTLDMIEAAILGNASPDVQEYMIQGRQIRRIDPEKMLALRAQYKALYKQELRDSGQYTSPRKIGFRFK